MRIALVGPELEENLALRYLHAAVLAGGHEGQIFPFASASQAAAVAEQIIAWRADVVGLSMVFTARAREFLDLATLLRQSGWQGHVVAGGHFASFHAEALLREFPALDSIIHGEAEEALVELIDRLESQQRQTQAGEGETQDVLRSLQAPFPLGVSARDGSGAVVLAQPRANIENLDSRPWPTRSDWFHDYLGQRIANMLSGRGCYANCHFCSINAWHRQNGGSRFRMRSAQCVAREMARLYHDHAVRIFNFHDDNFFLPDRRAMLARLKEMKAHLSALGVGRIAVQVKARPPDIHDDTLAALLDLGLFRVFLGVENAAVDGLRHLGRGVGRDQNVAALHRLMDAGVHVTFNLLVFEPDCTEADLRENVNFMRQFAPVPLNFCRTEVYSGTQLERTLRERGLLQGDYFGYWYRIVAPAMQEAFELFRAVFTPRNFTCEGLNHEAMRVDYYYHILSHFWPDRASADLHRRVLSAVARLNQNNADLMDAVLDQATRGDRANRTQCVAELSRQRAAFDNAMRTEMHALVDEMSELPTRRPAGSWGWLGTAAKAAAAAGLMITTAAASPGTDPAPKPVTDPAPRPGDSHLVLPGQQLAQGPDEHVRERAPAPLPPEPAPNPSPAPTSQPTSQPAALTPAEVDKLVADLDARDFKTRQAAEKRLKEAGSAIYPQLKKAREHKDVPPETAERLDRILARLSDTEIARIRAYLNGNEAMRQLTNVISRQGAENVTVDVTVTVAENGRITKAEAQLPKDRNLNRSFKTELERTLTTLTVPSLRSAGTTTVQMLLKCNWGDAPCEVAPQPGLEYAPVPGGPTEQSLDGEPGAELLMMAVEEERLAAPLEGDENPPPPIRLRPHMTEMAPPPRTPRPTPSPTPAPTSQPTSRPAALTPAEVAKLIVDLDAKEFKVRESAEKRLREAGRSIFPQLKTARDAKDVPPETADRLDRILKGPWGGPIADYLNGRSVSNRVAHLVRRYGADGVVLDVTVTVDEMGHVTAAEAKQAPGSDRAIPATLPASVARILIGSLIVGVKSAGTFTVPMTLKADVMTPPDPPPPPCDPLPPPRGDADTPAESTLGRVYYGSDACIDEMSMDEAAAAAAAMLNGGEGNPPPLEVRPLRPPHATEMIARPLPTPAPSPAAAPTSQPTSRPAALTSAEVAKLIVELDAKEFKVREAAEKRLMEAGPAIHPQLRKAREEKDVPPETAGRLDRILKSGGPEAAEYFDAISKSPRLGMLVRHYNAEGVVLDVTVTFDAAGRVTAAEAKPATNSEKAAPAELPDAVVRMLMGTRIPKAKGAGTATSRLTLKAVPLPPPPCDPAPMPRGDANRPGESTIGRVYYGSDACIDEMSMDEAAAAAAALLNGGEGNPPPLEVRPLRPPHATEMIARPLPTPAPSPAAAPTSQPDRLIAAETKRLLDDLRSNDHAVVRAALDRLDAAGESVFPELETLFVAKGVHPWVITRIGQILSKKPVPPATTQPGDTMTDTEATHIKTFFTRNGMAHLHPSATKHDALGKTVRLQLTVDASGWVKKVVVTPVGAPNPALKADLEQAVKDVEIPEVNRAGIVTIELRLTPPARESGWNVGS